MFNYSDKTLLFNVGSENIIKHIDKLYLGSVDFAFSSPPYFNIELYDRSSGGINQAPTTNYDDYIDWWTQTCENISLLMKPNGTIALNMVNDIKQKGKTVHNILDDMAFELLKFGYCEVDRIYLKMSRSHFHKKLNPESKSKLEPIVIFKRIQ